MVKEKAKRSNIAVLIQAWGKDTQLKDAVKSAKLLTDKVVVNSEEAKYVEELRAKAITIIDAEWVFLLDTDERMSRELAGEIKRVIRNEQFTSYKVPRKNIYGRRKWLKHGGWWPDEQIRLIKREALISWPKQIHSTPRLKGEQGRLKSPFIHYFHGDLEAMVAKTAVFEDIESDLLFKAGRAVTSGTFFRKYFGELYRRLIRRGGFMDGPIGIIEAIYQAFSKTITYLYLYEKKKSRSL